MQDIISRFLDITIFKIDGEGNILDTVINTKEDFKTTGIKNIYDIFDTQERERVTSVIQSGLDVNRKYLQLSKKTGISQHVEVNVSADKDDTYFYIEFSRSDVEREKMIDQYIERLTQQAHRDPLTKVYNRRGLEEKIGFLAETSDKKKRIGLIYIDIDNLKYVNDKYGHKAGDKAILSITDTLISTIRERDMIARLGGDEFLIVVEEITGSESTAYNLAKRLLTQTGKESKKRYITTISMGVHVFEIGKLSKYKNNPKVFASKWSKELEEADKATYNAKDSGRNAISVSKGFRKFYKL